MCGAARQVRPERRRALVVYRWNTTAHLLRPVLRLVAACEAGGGSSAVVDLPPKRSVLLPISWSRAGSLAWLTLAGCRCRAVRWWTIAVISWPISARAGASSLRRSNFHALCPACRPGGAGSRRFSTGWSDEGLDFLWRLLACCGGRLVDCVQSLLATTVKPTPCFTGARGQFPRRRRSSVMLVWKAMPSMTPMMSLILRVLR